MFLFLKKLFYYVFPITSFLVIPFIQGTTLAFCVISIFFFFIFLLTKNVVKIFQFYQILFFVFIFIVLQFLFSQIGDFVFKIPNINALPLVDSELSGSVLFRKTIFTQSIYLYFSFIVFSFVIVFFEKNDFNLIFIGIRVLLFFGFLEWSYFIITGNDLNFLSNRTFDHGRHSGSLFQIMSIGGHDIMRMKSLTGEPSMFAFTILPFWILAKEYNRKIDFYMITIALVLSLSTTALIGIFIYSIFIFVYSDVKSKLIFLILIFLILSITLYLFSDILYDIWMSLFIDKLSATSVSGMDRSGNIISCFNFWYQLNLWNKLFGIGFGVVRSTDFFSTILVNNGLFGLFFWFFLFFSPYLIGKPNNDLKRFFPAVLVTFILLFISVPEYMYLNIWIVLGITYKLKFQQYLKSNLTLSVE